MKWFKPIIDLFAKFKLFIVALFSFNLGKKTERLEAENERLKADEKAIKEMLGKIYDLNERKKLRTNKYYEFLNSHHVVRKTRRPKSDKGDK